MPNHRQWRTQAVGLILPITLLTIAACGDSDDGGNAGGTSSPDSSPSDSPTTGPTTSPTQTPALATCSNDEIGYTVGYPEQWHTNDGNVASACSFFDPEPVTVEEGTEPDTAISFNQSDTAFANASSPDAFDRVRSRDSATVDGREAVSVVEESSGQGMLEEGTLSYIWLVNLSDGTLVATTHDGPERDFRNAMDVLDRMMSNLNLAAPAPDATDGQGSPDETTGSDGNGDGNGAERDGSTERTVIARYDSGAQPFVVTAVHSPDETCLVASANGSEGDPACWSGAPDNGLTVRSLDVPGGADAIGGLAEPGLARVLAGLDDQGTVGFRPSDVTGTDVHAWAMPVGQPETHHVIGYTPDGEMTTMLNAQGEPTGVLPNVNTAPESTEPSSDVRLLTDVESGLHSGYDRVAFRFRDAIPGYDVSYTQRPVQEPGSGREVNVEGDAVILVRMESASGRERTGDGEQTYTGPQRLSGAGTYAITEIVQVGDFEGVLTWAIGVRGELPMRVQEFGDDLVVDVRHAEQ